MLPVGVVYQSEMAGLSPPKTVGLWQPPGFSFTVWACNPCLWSCLQFVAERHPILCSGVQVAGCGCSPFSQKLSLGFLEGSPHLPSKTDWVPRGWNLHQLWPPSWSLHPVGMPLHPLLGSSKGGFGIVDQLGSSPLLPDTSVPNRNSHTLEP